MGILKRVRTVNVTKPFRDGVTAWDSEGMSQFKRGMLDKGQICDC